MREVRHLDKRISLFEYETDVQLTTANNNGAKFDRQHAGDLWCRGFCGGRLPHLTGLEPQLFQGYAIELSSPL